MSLLVFAQALRRRLTADAVAAHIAHYDIRSSVASRLGLSLAELDQLAPAPEVRDPDRMVLEVRGVRLHDVVAAAGMRWTVRHDHPSGAHEFAGLKKTAVAARRSRRRDDTYWNHGMMRVPRTLTVVAIDPVLFRSHNRTGDCVSEACPR